MLNINDKISLSVHLILSMQQVNGPPQAAFYSEWASPLSRGMGLVSLRLRLVSITSRLHPVLFSISSRLHRVLFSTKSCLLVRRVAGAVSLSAKR